MVIEIFKSQVSDLILSMTLYFVEQVPLQYYYNKGTMVTFEVD